MKPVVYIAGPISDPDTCKTFGNLHRFFRMEVMLWRQGFSPINPAADIIAAIMDGGFEHRDFLDKDEALVSRADYIFLLPGYEYSKGAMQEYAWALRAGTVPVESIGKLKDHVEAAGADWIDDLPVDADA